MKFNKSALMYKHARGISCLFVTLSDFPHFAKVDGIKFQS